MIFSQLASGIITLIVLGFSTSTACTRDDIQACEAYLEVMAKSRVTPLTQDCKSIRSTVKCLEKLTADCPTNMRSLINSTIAGYRQAEEACGNTPPGREGTGHRYKRSFSLDKKRRFATKCKRSATGRKSKVRVARGCGGLRHKRPSGRSRNENSGNGNSGNENSGNGNSGNENSGNGNEALQPTVVLSLLASTVFVVVSYAL